MSDLARIVVKLPKGCDKKSLSINALDTHTRTLALNTFLYVDGKPLLCNALKFNSNGTLMLEVKPECFEIEG